MTHYKVRFILQWSLYRREIFWYMCTHLPPTYLGSILGLAQLLFVPSNYVLVSITYLYLVQTSRSSSAWRQNLIEKQVGPVIDHFWLEFGRMSSRYFKASYLKIVRSSGYPLVQMSSEVRNFFVKSCIQIESPYQCSTRFLRFGHFLNKLLIKSSKFFVFTSTRSFLDNVMSFFASYLPFSNTLGAP